MRATTCGVSDPADSSDKAIVGASAPCISAIMLSEGARPEVVRDILGHANIDVTQNVYRKCWWGQRVDEVASEMSKPSAKTGICFWRGAVIEHAPRLHVM